MKILKVFLLPIGFVLNLGIFIVGLGVFIIANLFLLMESILFHLSFWWLKTIGILALRYRNNPTMPLVVTYYPALGLLKAGYGISWALYIFLKTVKVIGLKFFDQSIKFLRYFNALL